ncbi:Uncharacterised protein [Bordetella trematum]|nr:Uncharacterised protein [Bordetella trematum]
MDFMSESAATAITLGAVNTIDSGVKSLAGSKGMSG